MQRQQLKEVLLDQRALGLKPDDLLRQPTMVDDDEVVVLSGLDGVENPPYYRKSDQSRLNRIIFSILMMNE